MLAVWLPILAQTTGDTRHLVTRGIQDHWGHDLEAIPLPIFIVVIVCFAVLLVGLRSLHLHRTREQRSHPLEVFHELAKELGLEASDRRLLSRIAKQQSLPSPLTLLLSHATMTHHAMLYWEGASSQRRAAGLRRIKLLCELLFGVVGHEKREG